MKIILTFIFITISLFASSDNATTDDIKMLIHQMDKRFEQVDKRFEQVDKRFEQVDKRFDQVDKRLDMFQQQMDKRFEQIDKRFEENHDLSMTIISIIVALFGFIIWDRRTMMNATKKEVVQELELELVKKADKNVLDKVIGIIEDMAKKDKEVESLLEKHHLKLV